MMPRISGLLPVYLAGLLIAPATLPSQTVLSFADFNSQGPFNDFSGDNGLFASRTSAIVTAFDTQVFHGTNGASLRIDYDVPSGFCGVWHSALGKASFPRYTLNFTNLYGALRNSPDNPSRPEGVRVEQFSFWARGDGAGFFDHKIKLEFKSPDGLIGSALFSVTDHTNWTHCAFPIAALGTNDVSRVKEIVFVLEDWRNPHHRGRLYLDDLTLTTDEPPCDPRRWGNEALLDVISQRAFAYFLTFVDDLGFALDRSTYSDMVSVGTVGFQLAAYCIGHRRGWADPDELERRVVAVLRNLERLPQGPEAGMVRAGHRGFYYHFLSANTGTRKDDHVELSLYDTMLLMYGVLTCKEYFADNPEIQVLSRTLFDRVEWSWMVDRSAGVNANRFYLAWMPGPGPEGTFLKHVDGQTDEALMVDVLGMGSGASPTTLATYLARNRVIGSYPAGHPQPVMVSWKGSLFNYFFAGCWLDFRARGFDLHPDGPLDLWENDRRAIVANRQFCIDHQRRPGDDAEDHYAGYGETGWGLTACDNLVPALPDLPSEYFSFGALPTEENIRFGTKAPHAGTIAVYGAASSINFLPEETLATLRAYIEVPALWSPFFGFGDAFSLDPHYLTGPYDTQGNPTIRSAEYLNGPWVNHMVMGINVGPMLLAIENYRTGMIWQLTGRNPEITLGLDRIFGISTPPADDIAIELRGSPPRVEVSWTPVPGAAEYSIFTSADLVSWKLRQAGIRGTTWSEPATNTATRYYSVKAIRGESRGVMSQRVSECINN